MPGVCAKRMIAEIDLVGLFASAAPAVHPRAAPIDWRRAEESNSIPKERRFSRPLADHPARALRLVTPCASRTRVGLHFH